MKRPEPLVHLFLLSFLLAACGGGDAAPEPDPAARQQAEADSVLEAARAGAGELVDSAKAVLATLLDNPTSATFDSVVVIQPPRTDGRFPAIVACGRIGGRPGIGGSRTPVRFIYQGKWTVFVEEAANQARFAELWGNLCDVAGGEVVLDGR